MAEQEMIPIIEMVGLLEAVRGRLPSDLDVLRLVMGHPKWGRGEKVGVKGLCCGVRPTGEGGGGGGSASSQSTCQVPQPKKIFIII